MLISVGASDPEGLRGHRPVASFQRRPAPALLAAAALVLGIWLSELLSASAPVWMMVCLPLLGWKAISESTTSGLLLTVVVAGGLAWSVRTGTVDPGDIRHVVAGAESTVRVLAVVDSIPVLQSSAEGHSDGFEASQSVRTQLLTRTTELMTNRGTQTVSGHLRVLIRGDLTSELVWGQQVQLTGRLQTRFDVRNPGEFDYGQFLRRQRISGILFVGHTEAVRIVNSPSWLSPWAVLSRIRQSSVQLIQQHVAEIQRPLAEALMLGNRGHLEPSLERDFVASGTMHLLSISGLHVGILYVFLLRSLNMLLVERRRCMLLGLGFCISYAFLTDLRSSVLRATLFIVFTVIGQIWQRQVRLSALIGNTALIFLLWDPGIAFDLGAWLSFLAVSALAWSGTLSSPESDDGQRFRRRPDALTWGEWWAEQARLRTGSLALRYRQMFGVTLFSAPLAAAQFHVVSLSSLVANLILIPLTGVAMISGFVFLTAGLLLPELASATGTIFSLLLSLFSWLVNFSGDLSWGAVSISTIPQAGLILYYALLAGAIIRSRVWIQKVCWTLLAMLVLAGFAFTSTGRHPEQLICTALSVGHGNAVVVETPDHRVLVFDAGALRRGERTADLVANYLWHQGQTRIDGLVISHADSDHFNAVTGLLDRMPVGCIYLSDQMAASNVAAVESVLHECWRRRIPVCRVRNGDRLTTPSSDIQFLQAQFPTGMQPDDNELSLLAILSFAGRRVAFPGDLEKRGQELLLPQITPVDVLLSPHHGSRTSNTAQTQRAFQPHFVVISGRSGDNDGWLQSTYGETARISNTSLDGAVTIRISPDGRIVQTNFCDRPRVNRD